MTREARELIYGLIDESKGDKIGGMSLVSLFLDELRDRSAEEGEALFLGLGEILEQEAGTRLTVCLWLVEALAANDVHSPTVEAKLRQRLAQEEAGSTHSDEEATQVLNALRKADLAVYAVSKRSEND